MRTTVARARDLGRDRPLAVVAVVASLQALASAVWLWSNRRLGSFDPDEAGYLAYALRFQRTIGPEAPGDVWREVLNAAQAPLVPLLSVVPLTVGPRDARAALLLQPVLLVITAVAAAGITRRLAGPGWAIVAGLTVAGLRTMVLASQSYWFGLGAAAATTVAVWALLASDRGANRRIWWFGVALGLAVLARTMVLGLLPGLVLGALVLAGRDRVRLQRVALAVGLGGLVAAPWYLPNRETVFGYLFDYGYGDPAVEWGEGGLAARVDLRLDRFAQAAGVQPWALVLLTAVLALVVVRHVRDSGGWRLTERRRQALAVALFVGVGTLALLSTRNRGIWFELPLVVAGVPLGLAAASRAPRRLQAALAVVMVAGSVLVPVALRASDTDHASTALATFDERFAGSSGERSAAADDWWAFDREVADELARLTERETVGATVVTGNTFMMNTNTIQLAAELDGWDARAGVLDSRLSEAALAEELVPRSRLTDLQGRRMEQIVVVVRQEGALFTPDRRWRMVEELARERGFVEVTTIAMPVGGDVGIYRHRDNIESRPLPPR